MAKAKAKVKSKAKPETSPAGEAQLHERTTKPGEAERIAKGRDLAANHLARRDGLEPEMARMIVEGMEPEEVYAIIDAANTAVIERDRSVVEAENAGGAVGAKVEIPPRNFVEYPGLVGSEQFPELVLECARKSKEKGAAEKVYKDAKGKLWTMLTEAGVKLDQRVECMGVTLTPYQGKSNPVLDARKLLEKGVSIDIINACYVHTKYDDVRVVISKDAVL